MPNLGLGLPTYDAHMGSYGEMGGADYLPQLPGYDPLSATMTGVAPKKGKGKKMLKKGLAGAAAMADAGMPDITQGMQPVQPFRMTGGLLGGMR
jgi:hypothetical protein